MSEFPNAFPPSQQGPLQPQYAPPEKRPVWPMVIGIIEICLGGLNLLCGLFQMAMGRVMQGIMKSFRGIKLPTPATGPTSTAPTQPFNMSEIFDPPEWLPYAQGGLQVAGYVLAVLLLVAGILLLKRVRKAAFLHLIYAVLAAGVVVAGVIVQWAFMRSINIPDAPPAFQRWINVQGAFMGCVGITIGMVYPTFLVIWFLRRTIRDQVRSWGRGAGLGAQQQTWDIPTAPPPAV